MSESLLLCFCDECINFPDEERWLPQYTIQYHKANNLFGGVAYNEWASANDDQFFDMVGLSEQDVNNDIDSMDADDDEIMEEDFSIFASGDDEEWSDVGTSAFEPEEVTTDVVKIDEIDQLVGTFSSNRFQ
ncbi:hypothetical protein EDC96DRAFT_569753 [Choanephora cucurbitarum]|nr:hypothetical protein EDC96DRAFT_569753 [Choanephora cucurbitarum]